MFFEFYFQHTRETLLIQIDSFEKLETNFSYLELDFDIAVSIFFHTFPILKQALE